MNNICNSFESQKIFKLIFYESEKKNDLIKLIFVGNRSDKIKEILFDLQEGKLSSSKSKMLNSEIPFYQKIFGNIIPNRTFFVFDYINEIELLYKICSNFVAPRILRVVSEI